MKAEITLEQVMKALEYARAEQYAAAKRAFYLEKLVREMLSTSSKETPMEDVRASVDIGWGGWVADAFLCPTFNSTHNCQHSAYYH